MSIRFAQPISLLVDDDLHAVTHGDVNGDSTIDLIVSRGKDHNEILMFLNDGAANFAPPINTFIKLEKSNSVNTLAAHDVNQDGKLDLIILATPTNNADDNSLARIAVALGDGKGGFGTVNTVTTQADASQPLIVADFNGDRYPDLAISQPTRLRLLFGDGRGGFQQRRSFRFGTAVAGDFNRDGHIDFVSSGATLLGNGKGRFRKITHVSSGLTGNLITGDFNNDRKLDLASVGKVALGNGAGKFPKTISFPFTSDHEGQYSWAYTTSVVAGDMNRDGKLDLIATDIYSGDDGGGSIQSLSYQKILLGNGRDKFFPPGSSSLGTSGRVTTLIVADFNQDSRLDIVVLGEQNNPSFPEYTEDTLQIGLNTGKGADRIFFNDLLVDASRESKGALQVDLRTGQLKLGTIRKNVSGYHNVMGTPSHDLIIGTSGYNELDGVAGADTLRGMEEGDVLYGGEGKDRLLGMGGDDSLTGGKGNDRLTGGEGRDSFNFAPDDWPANLSFRSLGIDRITDFTHGIDTIEVGLGWGKRGLGFATTEAQAERKFNQLVYIRSTGMLYYNPNGLLPGFGGGGAFADLQNGVLLTAADILS